MWTYSNRPESITTLICFCCGEHSTMLKACLGVAVWIWKTGLSLTVHGFTVRALLMKWNCKMPTRGVERGGGGSAISSFNSCSSSSFSFSSSASCCCCCSCDLLLLFFLSGMLGTTHRWYPSAPQLCGGEERDPFKQDSMECCWRHGGVCVWRSTVYTEVVREGESQKINGGRKKERKKERKKVSTFCF